VGKICFKFTIKTFFWAQKFWGGTFALRTPRLSQLGHWNVRRNCLRPYGPCLTAAAKHCVETVGPLLWKDQKWLALPLRRLLILLFGSIV